MTTTDVINSETSSVAYAVVQTKEDLAAFASAQANFLRNRIYKPIEELFTSKLAGRVTALLASIVSFAVQLALSVTVVTLFTAVVFASHLVAKEKLSIQMKDVEDADEGVGTYVDHMSNVESVREDVSAVIQAKIQDLQPPTRENYYEGLQERFQRNQKELKSLNLLTDTSSGSNDSNIRIKAEHDHAEALKRMEEEAEAQKKKRLEDELEDREFGDFIPVSIEEDEPDFADVFNFDLTEVVDNGFMLFDEMENKVEDDEVDSYEDDSIEAEMALPLMFNNAIWEENGSDEEFDDIDEEDYTQDVVRSTILAEQAAKEKAASVPESVEIQEKMIHLEQLKEQIAQKDQMQPHVAGFVKKEILKLEAEIMQARLQQTQHAQDKGQKLEILTAGNLASRIAIPKASESL